MMPVGKESEIDAATCRERCHFCLSVNPAAPYEVK